MAQSTLAFLTRRSLAADLRRLGVGAGDVVMVHAAMRKVGRLLNGPDALIGALRDASGPGGAVLAYVDWDARYEELLDDEGRLPDAWRAHAPPFDAETSRAARDNGAFAEFLRTTPGAKRSGNPGASVAAVGALAEFITSSHALDFGYGEDSPFAKLVALRGKVLMVGAPLDSMTVLHHAEHLAQIPHKRVRRIETPFAAGDGVAWRMIEEFETSRPVVAGLADDYFATIVAEYLAGGRGAQGLVGEARAILVDATDITGFAVDWLEAWAGAKQKARPDGRA